MKSRLKALVKQSKWLYTLYFKVGSFVIRFIGLFIKTDPNLILFISYGGQKYDDSPRVVYEYLKSNPVSEKHNYIWAFIEPDNYPQIPNCVKVDTLAYYITALKAGYWITNSSASRGLDFRKKATKNILFQHGMAGIKKIGTDIKQSEKAYSLGFHETFDAVFIEGKKEIPILTNAWKMDKSIFHTTGLPRNDDLCNVTESEIACIKNKLKLPQDKKVILYAPTFREFCRSSDGFNALGIPVNFDKWERLLGDQYVLLVTAHYEVAKLLDALPENRFVFNAFKYPELNELLKVSDILISDYSSIVFDYSILGRPILCYGYDYESYAIERGLYTDLDKLFSHGVLRTEDELLTVIQNMNYDEECVYTRAHIKDEYIASYGDAAEKTIKVIFGDAELHSL